MFTPAKSCIVYCPGDLPHVIELFGDIYEPVYSLIVILME